MKECKIVETAEAIRQAQLIATVTSSVNALEIIPTDFLPGAVVCDVARPRNIAEETTRVRDDLLVFAGPTLTIPGKHAALGLDIGFPPGETYPCMAETLTLALESWTDDYSLGRYLRMEQVEEIVGLAKQHGFHNAGLRNNDTAITPEQIAGVKERAEARRKKGGP